MDPFLSSEGRVQVLEQTKSIVSYKDFQCNYSERVNWSCMSMLAIVSSPVLPPVQISEVRFNFRLQAIAAHHKDSFDEIDFPINHPNSDPVQPDTREL